MADCPIPGNSGKSDHSNAGRYFEGMITWQPKNVMQVFLENDDGDPLEIYPPGPVDPLRSCTAG